MKEIDKFKDNLAEAKDLKDASVELEKVLKDKNMDPKARKFAEFMRDGLKDKGEQIEEETLNQ